VHEVNNKHDVDAETEDVQLRKSILGVDCQHNVRNIPASSHMLEPLT
jgi:hypothetical protein